MIFRAEPVTELISGSFTRITHWSRHNKQRKNSHTHIVKSNMSLQNRIFESLNIHNVTRNGNATELRSNFYKNIEKVAFANHLSMWLLLL